MSAQIVRLHSVGYDKRKLDSVPDDERVLHFALSQSANEVTTLQKLALSLLLPIDAEPQPSRDARTGSALVLLRLLAGRVYEVWKVLEGGAHARIFGAYQGEMEPDSIHALEELKRYFNRADNVIKRVRKKVAFHTDINELRETYAKTDFEFRDFYAASAGNTFYLGASMLSTFATVRATGIEDLQQEFDKFAGELLRCAAMTVLYINGFGLVFVNRYLGLSAEEFAKNVFEIEAPPLSEMKIPYFIYGDLAGAKID